MESWRALAWSGIAIMAAGVILGLWLGANAAAAATVAANNRISSGHIQFGSSIERQVYVSQQVGGAFVQAFLLWGGAFMFVGVVLLVAGYASKPKRETEKTKS